MDMVQFQVIFTLNLLPYRRYSHYYQYTKATKNNDQIQKESNIWNVIIKMLSLFDMI